MDVPDADVTPGCFNTGDTFCSVPIHFLHTKILKLKPGDFPAIAETNEPGQALQVRS